MTKRRPIFRVGNQVRVKTANRDDATIYEITKLLPYGGCFIREIGLAPNGKPYAEQRFDVTLLKHVVTDEMLEAFSLGGLKATRKGD